MLTLARITHILQHTLQLRDLPTQPSSDEFAFKHLLDLLPGGSASPVIPLLGRAGLFRRRNNLPPRLLSSQQTHLTHLHPEETHLVNTSESDQRIFPTTTSSRRERGGISMDAPGVSPTPHTFFDDSQLTRPEATMNRKCKASRSLIGT